MSSAPWLAHRVGSCVHARYDAGLPTSKKNSRDLCMGWAPLNNDRLMNESYFISTGVSTGFSGPQISFDKRSFSHYCPIAERLLSKGDHHGQPSQPQGC